MAITGKQRSSRIDRRYTSSVDPSIRWKRWIGWIGLGLGLLYGAWILFSPSGERQISTGELSKAHGAWNETGCEKCHVPFSPIRDSSFGRSDEAIKLSNEKCNHCHQIGGHFEHAMKPEKLARESCVQCHHEHLGALNNLKDIADKSCVRCHSDLTPYSNNTTRDLARLSSFSDHPKFRDIEGTDAGLAKDPGTIAFSHIQHMRPGQPTNPGDASAFRFDQLDEQYKAKYANRKDAQGFIQLKCSDCHERDHAVAGYEDREEYIDLTNPLKETQSKLVSNSHVLYREIKFSDHCQACHGRDIPQSSFLPHEANVDQVIKAVELKNLETVKSAQEFEPGQTPNAEESNLLSKRTIESLAGRDLLTKLQNGTYQLADKQILHEKLGCKKCHQAAVVEGKDIVQPSQIRKKWLTDATFNHGAHVNIRCQICHTIELESIRASPAPLVSSVVTPKELRGQFSSQILIEGVESCRGCHIVDEKKRLEKQNVNPHVATADCIDCHRYHTDAPPAKVLPAGQAILANGSVGPEQGSSP